MQYNFCTAGFLLKEMELSYSGRKEFSSEPLHNTAREIKTAKRSSDTKQAYLLHSETPRTEWKTGRSLKSRKTRQVKRLQSAGVESLRERIRHEPNFSVSVAEAGKGRVPQQTPPLSTEDSAAFVPENFAAKKTYNYSDTALSMCPTAAESVPSTEMDTASQYSSVREAESVLTTEEHVSGERKYEKLIPSYTEWLHQTSRKESKQWGNFMVLECCIL